MIALASCGDPAPQPRSAPPPDASAPAPQRKSLGQLEGLQGTVTLDREGRKLVASPGAVYAQDVIETGADGSALLRFSGDRVVELGPDGRYEVDLDGSGAKLNVVRGLVLTRVKATPDPDVASSVLVTISTPFGLTRVGSAELTVRVGSGAAEVDVRLGEVELVSVNGVTTKLSEGRNGLLGEIPETELSVMGAGGRAELKARGGKNFAAINPKNLPSFKVGDVVRVKEGPFSLGPKGSATRFSLLTGAELTLGQSRKGSSREATAFDVRKGGLEISAPQGQSTRVVVADGVTLVSDLPGQYLLRKTGSGFELDALAGDVTVERDSGPSTLVPGGQSASISLKGPTEVRPASKESLVLPSRTGLRVYHQGLKQVTLSWDDGDGARTQDWRVELAADPAFARMARQGIVHDNFLTVPVPAKGGWYWRVWKGEKEHAKGQVSFAVEPRFQDLSRLKNVVPEGPDTTTIFFQDKDKPPVVTFTWNREEMAVRYAVKVYREGQLAVPVAERTEADTRVSLPENTLVEGKYLWSVTPLDSKGAALKGGRMNKLHMVFDNAVVALTINSPRNGEVGGKSVQAAGIAPVGSRLFINGKPITLDEQARFDTSVAPLPGGRIIFRLLHGGAEVYTVRTVRNR